MRDHTINLNINFPVPLRIVVEIRSDARQVLEITEELKESTDSLEQAVAANQPKP